MAAKSWAVIRSHAQRRGDLYLDTVAKIEKSLLPNSKKLDLATRLVTRSWTINEIAWMNKQIDSMWEQASAVSTVPVVSGLSVVV